VLLSFILQRDKDMSDVYLSMSYNDSGLNDLLGLDKITSSQKIQTFLHDKMRFLCIFIANEMRKRAPTPGQINAKAAQLTHGFSNDKSSLIIHKRAYNMAYKTWIGNKKMKDRDMPEPTGRGGKTHDGKPLEGRYPTQYALKKKPNAVKLFRVKQLKGGISYTRFRGKKKKAGVEYEVKSFQALQDFYETKYRTTAPGNISRIFELMAKEARRTRQATGPMSGEVSVGSAKNRKKNDEASYVFGDTYATVSFKSLAFGIKGFPEEVRKYNHWLTNPPSEGKSLYPGSKSQTAIEKGLELSKTDIMEHLRQKGISFQ
jgi:hypothetical protein